MDTALNAFFDLPTEISKDDKNIMVGWLPKPPMNGRCRVVVVAAGVSLGDH
jgi:cell division GTPase FtsZ